MEPPLPVSPITGDLSTWTAEVRRDPPGETPPRPRRRGRAAKVRRPVRSRCVAEGRRGRNSRLPPPSRSATGGLPVRRRADRAPVAGELVDQARRGRCDDGDAAPGARVRHGRPRRLRAGDWTPAARRQGVVVIRSAARARARRRWRAGRAAGRRRGRRPPAARARPRTSPGRAARCRTGCPRAGARRGGRRRSGRRRGRRRPPAVRPVRRGGSGRPGWLRGRCARRARGADG